MVNIWLVSLVNLVQQKSPICSFPQNMLSFFSCLLWKTLNYFLLTRLSFLKIFFPSTTFLPVLLWECVFFINPKLKYILNQTKFSFYIQFHLEEKQSLGSVSQRGAVKHTCCPPQRMKTCPSNSLLIQTVMKETFYIFFSHQRA